MRAGIGLRAPHVREITERKPPIGWLEVHAENYMGGGPAIASLERLRRDYPIAIHGVGLSLGSADGLDLRHLERIEPAIVSEHLSWSTIGGAYLNHLLPLPYTEETLDVVATHVARVQDRLRRQLLVENPSSYLRFRVPQLDEPDFLNTLVLRTGCGVLCDVNNVWVSCHNLGDDADAWIDALDADAVGEIHLAGHAVNGALLIDDHGSRVCDAVWRLYERAIARFGARPTLIEWDTDVPSLEMLMAEAEKADAVAV